MLADGRERVRIKSGGTHCSSIHRSMTRTHPITHNTRTVVTVCLCFVATTASRSACSHLIPMKPGWHLQQGWKAVSVFTRIQVYQIPAFVRLHETHVVAVAQRESAQRVDLQKHVHGELAYAICAGT